MKKLCSAVAAVVLALPAIAWSATPYVDSFKPGMYEGTINSIVPEINGKKVKLEVKRLGDNVVGTVSYDGGQEVWTWNDKTLNQREVDPKTNNALRSYNASATTPAKATEQRFAIQCKTNQECDGGIDFRNTWVLKGDADTITYTVFGVSKDKKADLTAQPVKRHEFSFKMTK